MEASSSEYAEGGDLVLASGIGDRSGGKVTILSGASQLGSGGSVEVQTGAGGF